MPTYVLVCSTVADEFNHFMQKEALSGDCTQVKVGGKNIQIGVHVRTAAAGLPGAPRVFTWYCSV